MCTTSKQTQSGHFTNCPKCQGDGMYYCNTFQKVLQCTCNKVYQSKINKTNE